LLPDVVSLECLIMDVGKVAVEGSDDGADEDDNREAR
jgi:hypothetical protein